MSTKYRAVETGLVLIDNCSSISEATIEGVKVINTYKINQLPLTIQIYEQGTAVVVRTITFKKVYNIAEVL